jgi:hypothetical protein
MSVAELHHIDAALVAAPVPGRQNYVAPTPYLGLILYSKV